MKQFNETFEDNLEKTIEAIEEKTSVEVVVSIAPAGDSYVDTYFKGGLIAFFIMFLFIWYLPIDFPPDLVPIDLAAAFIIGLLVVKYVTPLRRLLVSGKRKEKNVRRAANAFFWENGLTQTIERTAFLVHISVFERMCILIGDDGVMNAVPKGLWKDMEHNFQEKLAAKMLPQTILELLPTVTPVFADHLPPAENNIDELSNRLRRF